MYRITEMTAGRRKKAPPPRHLPDTYRIFNTGLPARNNILERIHSEYTPKKQQQPCSTLEWRNNPQPSHTKCITTNARFFNEPVLYVDTEDTKTKQDQWWPSCEPAGHLPPKPPYDKQSTQRSDFQRPSCRLSRPVKYSSTLLPSKGIGLSHCNPLQNALQFSLAYSYCICKVQDVPRGIHLWNSLPQDVVMAPDLDAFKRGLDRFMEEKTITVPLACPRTPNSLPRIFQEQFTFKYQYNARATPCVPYQGKKLGALVWTEIKPTRGEPCAEGSESLGQPKTGKRHSVESCMTSPCCLPLPDSQETPDSNTHLSKTDISARAKTDPRATEEGQGSSGGIAQTNGVEVSPSCGEAPSKPLGKGALDKLQQDPLPPVPTAEQSPVKIQAA